MATIFGGERPLDVVRIDDSSVSISGIHTFYTVPAGRYAKVEVEYIKLLSASGTLNGSELKFGPTIWDEEINWEVSSGTPGGVFGDTWQKSGNTDGVVAIAGELNYKLLSSETISHFISSTATEGYILIATIVEFANP